MRFDNPDMKFLSVDGGATKTISAVYDDSFEIYTAGVSGPSNFRTAGMAAFRKNIMDAVNQVYSEDIEEMTFALPGIKDTSRSTSVVTGILQSIFKPKKLRIYNDGEAGFHSRFPEGEGIVAAAGTGMVCYGKLKGKSVRSSGWGWFLDDEGGAFYIARRALQEVVKIVDGRADQDSILVDRIAERLNIKEYGELINIIYRSRINIKEISSLAILVSSSAEKGDLLSKRIMEESAYETSRAILATYRRLNFPEKIGISGYGGVFRAGGWYWEMVKGHTDKFIHNSEYREPYFGYEAIIGSMVLTYNSLGIDVELKDLEDIRKQLNERIQSIEPSRRRKYLYF
jgi:N-acetylglucosamine kinase-like BadF-type ATPase